MADQQNAIDQYIGAGKEVLDTPVLLLDLDVLERNILKMSKTIIGEAGVGWRPHTKAMKNPDLARLCLDAGAHGVTCAKLGEAEVMADGGITDILVARSEEHTSELQSQAYLVCRLLLEKKKHTSR